MCVFPYSALRRSDGTFVFNGNWAINWSGEYQAAGTTFAYRRQDTTTPELITTLGPLTEPIDIMVQFSNLSIRKIGGKKKKMKDDNYLIFLLIKTGDLPAN